MNNSIFKNKKNVSKNVEKISSCHIDSEENAKWNNFFFIYLGDHKKCLIYI